MLDKTRKSYDHSVSDSLSQLEPQKTFFCGAYTKILARKSRLAVEKIGLISLGFRLDFCLRMLSCGVSRNSIKIARVEIFSKNCSLS